MQQIIADQAPADYVRADLVPKAHGVQALDLTAIAMPSNSFDFLIANHVLEHVADDEKALVEIVRVLRPGGHAILQTPFAANLRAKFEDPRIQNALDRLRAYGQEDHCRLYGADFASYVARFGFIDRTTTHTALLPGVDARVAGVNPHEPLLLFVKPGFM